MPGMNPWLALWRRLKPEPAGVPAAEQWRSALAGTLAVLFTSWVSLQVLGSPPFVIAPVGASTVILFALPNSPFAQPWSLVGGYLVSGIAGIAAASWVPDVPLAVALAAGLTILGSMALRCLHPPGGAVALYAVLGGEPVRALGWKFLYAPVLLNALLLLVAAVVLNNLLPGRRYPRPLPEAEAEAPPPAAHAGLSRRDLHEALHGLGHLVDVSNEELDEIVGLAERHAFRRNFGELRCAELMRAAATVRPDTSLHEAWRRLRRPGADPLLVVDSLGRVEGILALGDFVRGARAEQPQGLRGRLFSLLRRNFARDNAAGALMRRDVPTVGADDHVAALVAPLVAGAPLVAVVDAERRLLGAVRPGDLVGVLHGGVVAGAARADT